MLMDCKRIPYPAPLRHITYPFSVYGIGFQSSDVLAFQPDTAHRWTNAGYSIAEARFTHAISANNAKHPSRDLEGNVLDGMGAVVIHIKASNLEQWRRTIRLR